MDYRIKKLNLPLQNSNFQMKNYTRKLYIGIKIKYKIPNRLNIIKIKMIWKLHLNLFKINNKII